MANCPFLNVKPGVNSVCVGACDITKTACSQDDYSECDHYITNEPDIIVKPTIKDPIKPDHYRKARNGNDVINYAQDNDLSFDQGCIIKYVTRYKNKNGLEDLYKAQQWLERLIRHEQILAKERKNK